MEENRDRYVIVAYLQNTLKKKSNIPFRMSNKFRILKNLLFLAFSQCLVFTAFDSLSNLQSTINNEDGLGLASQAVIYACFTISSFFLPTFCIRRLGCKSTLVICVFSICPYILANLYLHWASLIPTAVLCGTAFGPLWAARSTYINDISHEYTSEIQGSIHVVNAWFFGISAFFHENAEVWGNVISYFVLKPMDNEVVFQNVTNITLSNCGAAFCSDDSTFPNPNLIPPSNSKRQMLTHIYFSLVVVAGIIIKLLVDPLAENDSQKRENARITCDLLVATFKHMKNRNQLLLIPLSFYCGLADGFYNSDFTKSYIACSWGISLIGFVTISYGVACALMDCSSGVLVKFFTRIPVFLLGAISHGAMLITCIFWKPTPETPIVFYVLSGIYGIGSSVWWSQIAAFYGVIFKNDEEAAFSNFYFWSSLGLLVAYAYGNTVCTATKIYVLLVFLMCGIISYLVVEKQATKENSIDKEQEETELSGL